MSAVASPSRLHTITALVQNETGTLNRLVSLFRRRGFSLASLNAGDCEQPGLSRLTLVVEGDEADLYQCLRQLEKLIDVVEVQDLRPEQAVERELALVRVEPQPEDRPMVHSVAAQLGARTPRVSESSIVIETSAAPAEIERLVEALRPYNVTEIVRSGLLAMRV
jgi:acetolactate synthase-1/3 small subunit